MSATNRRNEPELAPAVRQLITAIESAFPDAPPPPYDRGLDHLLHEDAAVFRRTRWQAIVGPRLPHDAVYFFSDDAAYRYYLPALLTTVLRWPDRAANLRQATIGSLVPPRKDLELGLFFARMAGFTLEQCRAIRDFLVHFDTPGAPEGDPARALRRYWGRAAL